MNAGWIRHSGGPCPVNSGEMLDVLYRDGGSVTSVPALEPTGKWRDAERRFWAHEQHHSDIIGYRLLGRSSVRSCNAERGYAVHYHAGEPNRCPGCGRSNWLVGRFSAECAFCATALPLAPIPRRPH